MGGNPSIYVQPLDFKKIIVDMLLGSSLIFLFAFIIFQSILAARFNMSPKVFGILMLVNVIILIGFLGQSLLLLVGVIIAIAVYAVIKRFVQF